MANIQGTPSEWSKVMLNIFADALLIAARLGHVPRASTQDATDRFPENFDLRSEDARWSKR
jgi:hypothetical protein